MEGRRSSPTPFTFGYLAPEFSPLLNTLAKLEGIHIKIAFYSIHDITQPPILPISP